MMHFTILNLFRRATAWQSLRLGMGLVLLSIASPPRPTYGDDQAARPTLEVPNATAAAPAEMKPYTDRIAGSKVTFEMLPIAGGKFMMGSPAGEAKRNDDEGPLHEVEIAPFWMGKCEVTWDEYEIFMFGLDVARRKAAGGAPSELDKLADAVTRPTKPYTDMSFGMGKQGFPAICMTQLAAKKYCQWVSAKTGRYYRLPTEAEWEYACRAGTTTAYHFGDEPAELNDYAWSYDNADDHYHKVGLKKPNPWGLFDMHGNVSEWCCDQYLPDFYAQIAGQLAVNPLAVPTQAEPCVVRGGSWEDDPDRLRGACRRGSHRDWKQQDPQLPQSIWYYTDAQFVGFRVVRPLLEPSAEDKLKYEVDLERKDPNRQ
ncbi:MAG TPA: SUMF1/EgtB/PvdO family nonheme iron enzyme [Pirellulales bacterium]|nr:SUMF1/EgtB/PvdO family nonheme iron enzyme [Pirellulales bacterium]